MSVRSVRRWDIILSKPARPVPWYLWPAALAAAFVGGILVTDPKIAVLLFGGIALFMALRATLARPINGFLLALCIFPEYTLFRGICQLYQIPLPFSLIGMWPEVILAIMTVSLLITAAKTGKLLRLTWLDLPAIILFASGLYGVLISGLQLDSKATLYGFHGSLTPFCFYFLARWLHHRPDDTPRILRYSLIGFALLAAFSIYDFLFRPEFFIRVAIQVRDQFWGQFEPHTFFRWYPRMQSLLFAEQIWGSLCGLVGIFCMARLGQPSLRTRQDARWRRMLWVIFSLALFGLIFSMSRGAQICWAVACVTLFCFRGGHRRIIVIGTALGAVTLLVAFALFGSSERVNWVAKRAASLTDRKSELAYERVNQWTRALKVFPLFPAGRGIGKVGGAAMYHNTGDGFDFVADGGYFKILAEQGLPGTLLFLGGSVGLIGVLMFIGRQIQTRGPAPVAPSAADDAALALTALAFFCGMLVQNIGGNIFDAYYLSELFWLLAGLVVGRYTAGISRPVLSPAGARLLPAYRIDGETHV